MPRLFGTPDGVRVGQIFIDRKEMRLARLHRHQQAGISGLEHEGADSIVRAGGYADDEDHGDYIIYTGQGGQDSKGRQAEDQDLNYKGNAALVTSMIRGLPVRVTRKAKVSKYSPPAGYRYAGVFNVTHAWTAIGIHGFRIVRFRLDRISEQDPLVDSTQSEPDPAFATTTVSRRIRDSAVAREIKRIYKDECQMCGMSVTTFADSRYSEGAHIRPLGRPHFGIDSLQNILCLCPNHHVQLDFGGLLVRDDLSVTLPYSRRTLGELKVDRGHSIDLQNIRYHRELWQKNEAASERLGTIH